MRRSSILLVSMVLAACSGVQRAAPGADAPQLGLTAGVVDSPDSPSGLAGSPTPPAAGLLPTEPAATATLLPTPAPPEGVILLPTQPRAATTALPPGTPASIFPAGVLEATLAGRPAATPDVATYSAVYQSYQGGVMLYIAEFRQVWVLVETTGKRGGPYYRFDDMFVDGDAEEIAGLLVPDGLLQPHRGFGRIWREQPGLRGQLGWATNYELPFAMRAARVASGALDARGDFVVGQVVWMATLPDDSIAYLNEATSTWGIASNQ